MNVSRANQNNKSFRKWHQIWRQMLQMKRKANESEASGEARLSEVKRQHTQAQTQTENLLTDGQTRTHTHTR